MLEIRNLHFAFPGHSFHFDLKLPDRSLTAIMGPSGGGKSTLLHLIAGFESPSTGDILFNGENLTVKPPGGRPLSIIFQDNNLFPHLTLKDNVALGLSNNLKLRPGQQNEVESALAKVGLADLGDKMPGTLSGGERQRAAIARTLLRDKPLLLLDEAFAALGPAMRQDMLQLVKQLHDERGLTTLMVTHHPADAKAIASHVAFISDGTVKVFGTTEDVLQNSSYVELQAYLGAARETV